MDAGFCESRQKQILITVGREGIYRYDKKTDTLPVMPIRLQDET